MLPDGLMQCLSLQQLNVSFSALLKFTFMIDHAGPKQWASRIASFIEFAYCTASPRRKHESTVVASVTEGHDARHAAAAFVRSPLTSISFFVMSSDIMNEQV
jgi:hypothetical protein